MTAQPEEFIPEYAMYMQQMLENQRQLQINAYGKDPATITDPDERMDFIRWNVLALEDELHEALQETGWKPWAKSKHLNEAAFGRELVDAWHFFMNLMLVSNIDMETFYGWYMAKARKNAQRQAEGYDGVSTKCQKCKRALDDEEVNCKGAPGEPVGIVAYCGLYDELYYWEA